MSVGSVSSSTVSGILQNTVARLQSQLTTAVTESSSGKLADVGLTLGAGSGQDVALHQQMADLAAISASNHVVTSQLDAATNALNGLQSAAQSLLAQFVGGAQAAPGSNGATAIQQAASGALQNFAALSNAEIGGVYVFGGINSGAAPIAAYAQTPPSAAQTAVANAFQSYFGFSMSSPSVSGISGAQMAGFLSNQFAALFSGANWTSTWSSASDSAQTNRIGVNQTVATSISVNQSGFQDMAQALTMVSEFGGLNLSGDAHAALMNAAQATMTGASNGLIEANATIGLMQNQVKEASGAVTLQQNVLTERINAVETVNSYAVASQVSNLTTQLQTAYSLTAQIHKLSLVNFL